MKFGKYLEHLAVPKWRLYYMDYAFLKKNLKDLKKSDLPMEALERSFIASLDAEVKKVNDFFMVTSAQIEAKLDAFSKLVTHENFYVSSSESLKREVEGFVRDLIDLDHYTKVNYEGFRKIMKKYDKNTGKQGSPWFMQGLKEQPFYTNSQQFSSLILKFSKCCAGCRRVLGENPERDVEFQKGMDTSQERTFLMFVKKDDIMTIKTEVARNLPIFLRHATGKETKESSLVWNCYYDDKDLSIYEKKLGRTGEYVSIRFRTYENSKTVKIERRISYADKRVEGVKDNFDLPYHEIFNFIQGEFDKKKYQALLKSRGVPKHETKILIDLFSEVQTYIQTEGLRPALSTRFRRTYFQNAGNKTVTVCLDEDVEFVREHFQFTMEGPKWHRLASSVPEKERFDFPYAILEIKLILPPGREIPIWVERLLNSPVTESVIDFSKFVHGCAVLCVDKVQREPAWMPQLNQSEREKRKSQFMSDVIADSPALVAAGFSIQRNFEEEEDDDERGFLIGKSKEREGGNLFDCFSSAKKDEYGTFCFPPTPTADLKVEPKTFFSAERTFIQWASFCVVIQTIGVAFLGFSGDSNSKDDVARIGGEIYLVIAFVFLLYALYQYRARSFRMRAQEHGNYDDFYGPFFLVVCLCTACIINLVLSVSN